MRDCWNLNQVIKLSELDYFLINWLHVPTVLSSTSWFIHLFFCLIMAIYFFFHYSINLFIKQEVVTQLKGRCFNLPLSRLQVEVSLGKILMEWRKISRCGNIKTKTNKCGNKDKWPNMKKQQLGFCYSWIFPLSDVSQSNLKIWVVCSLLLNSTWYIRGLHLLLIQSQLYTTLNPIVV